MSGNSVFFKVEVDAQGAVQGFRVSRKELQRLRREAEKAGVAANQSAKGMKRMGQETKKAGQHAKHAGSSMHSMQLIMAGMFAIATVRQAILYADTFKNLDARIRVSTDSLKDFNRAQAATQDIAQRTFSTIESTTELYARLSLAMRDTEVSQQDILRVTETLNKAYQLAGATAQEASASVIQLSQGLAAGALRGDEFRSVIEQAPRVVTALTDALGLTRGELRLLANDGKLTTEIIIQALLEQGAVIDKEFPAIERTVGRAFTLLRNQTIVYVGEADKASGVTESFANAVKSLSENLDTVATIGIAAVTVALIAFAPAIASATVAFGALIASMGPFGLAAIGIGIAVVALREYFDSAIDAAGGNRELVKSLEELNTAQGLARHINNLRAELSALTTEQAGLKDELARLEGLETPFVLIGTEVISVKEAIANTKTEMSELDAVIVSVTASEKKAAGELKKLTAAEVEAIKTAKELLNQGRLKKEALVAYVEALKLAKGAVSKYGDEQQRADLINQKYDAQLKKIRKGLVGVAGAEKLLAAAILAVSKARLADLAANRDSITSIDDFKDALQALQRQLVDTEEEGFLKLEIIIEELSEKFGDGSAEVEAMREQLLALRLELEEIGNAGRKVDVSFGRFGGGINSFSGLLTKSIETGFKDGFGKVGEVWKNAFSDNGFGGSADLAGQGALFALGAINAFQSSQASGQTILSSINKALLAVPYLQYFAAIAEVGNAISGGYFFGTKFKTKKFRTQFDFTSEGASGFTEEDQKKKNPVFGVGSIYTYYSFLTGNTSSKRTLIGELDPETKEAIIQLFGAANDALKIAAETLGIEAAAFVDAAFNQVFDKDGNLKSSVSTVNGKTYNETFQNFSNRLVAEQIIAQVGVSTGNVEVTRSLTPEERNSQAIGAIGGFGGEFAGLDFSGIFDLLGIPEQVTELVNEAQFIAERWRFNADLLLEGAELMLIAQSAINDGEGLFDSLILVVDVVEDLQKGGETLSEAYTRISLSTAILEDALGLLDQSFDISRESFVRFAEEFTDAAGSVDNAALLWKNYFNAFFDADELLDARLRVAQRVSAKELADIGLGPDVGRAEFRRLFEDILPTLSADALNEWLQAASALGSVLTLEEQLANIRTDSVNDLITAFDDVRTAVGDLLGSTINDLRRELLSPEALFKELKTSAIGLAGQLPGAQSREEVQNLVTEINALVRDSRGVAGDTRFNPGLIDFLQQVSVSADTRLGELQASAVADAELALREINSREGFVGATATFAESVQTFGNLITAEGGIVISGNDGSTLQESIVDGIREGFDLQAMALMFENFARGVATFTQATQFQAANPPTFRFESAGSNELGLT